MSKKKSKKSRGKKQKEQKLIKQSQKEGRSLLAEALDKKKKPVSRLLWFKPILIGTLFSLALILVFGASVYLGFESFYQNRTLPNVYAGTIPVGGLTYTEAEQVLHDSYSSFAGKKITFMVDTKSYELSFSELGVSFDFDRVITDLHKRNPHDIWQALFVPTQVPSGFVIDEAMFIHALQRAIPEIALSPKNAQVRLVIAEDKQYFDVVPSEAHVTTDFIKLQNTVNHMLEQGYVLPVVVSTFQGQPEISDEEANEAIRKSKEWLNRSVTLTFDDNNKHFKTDIVVDKDWNWLAFVPEQGKLQIRLSDELWQKLMNEKVSPAIEQEQQNVTVSWPEEGSKYAKVSGQLQDGYHIDQKQSRSHLEAFFDVGVLPDGTFAKEDTATIALQVEHNPAHFISAEGRDLGLTDLLGVGYSRFRGSSKARIFNITRGLGLLNNVILAPNETLSFNSLLGPVTVKAGWKEELVIKEGGKKTEPEAGGGLCQVSTTTYRAVVESGLKVVERRAHSYLVSYYVGDDDARAGIDATIYPGSQDLVFTNDTANYILVQTEVTSSEAFVRIYGTSDGRKVELDGPYKSGWRSPGSPILIPTTDLPPGETRITKKAHSGRTVSWNQIITYADGRVEKNDIISVYKAIPAEGIVGIAPPAIAEVNPDTSGNITL